VNLFELLAFLGMFDLITIEIKAGETYSEYWTTIQFKLDFGLLFVYWVSSSFSFGFIEHLKVLLILRLMFLVCLENHVCLLK